MISRTRLIDILRFAWVLWRHPYRQHSRIGQLIANALTCQPPPPEGALYTMSNDTLTQCIAAYGPRRRRSDAR
jgi:hypothetical protein